MITTTYITKIEGTPCCNIVINSIVFRLGLDQQSFANILRVDYAQDAPLFFCSDKSPKSVASPADAIVINSILETLGGSPEKHYHPRIFLFLFHHDTDPVGIIIQPVELFVLTPEITEPQYPDLSVRTS